MKALFYTSIIFAGAMLLFVALFPRGKFAPMPAVPAKREDGMRPEAAVTAHSPMVPDITRGLSSDGAEPRVETLEELTKNWTVIPPSAFPRKVKLLREAVFRSTAGSSKLPAGTSVVALACDQGVLNLAPDEGSSVRGMARVGDTDLGTQFIDSYAKWSAMRMETLRKHRVEERRNQPPEPAIVPGGVDQSGKPVRSSDGTYPVLVASMKSGQVTDITLKKIKMWGTPQLTKMEGRPTWVIDVNYDTIVFCGPLEARAQAHIRDGKVIRWVFPGSGELVP